MKSFPMFIRTTGRRVVIVGGGEQAAWKARLILKTDAMIELVAERLEDELEALVAEGRATHRTALDAKTFEGAAMAFIATGCPGFDAAAHGLAQAARCPANVVDRPDRCDLTTPSIVDRAPLVIAIGTEGTAPVLARGVKTQLEELLPRNLGGLAALAGRLRPSVAARVPRAKRRAFWKWVFDGAPRRDWAAGAERQAAAAIKTAIAAGGAPDAQPLGHIALVGAGPGARDLLTLRAVQRLQEADVIYYDRLVDPDVLKLARRDAERVFVGKHIGAHAWPQEKICAVITRAAAQGQRVVRLKSGDPGIFGRATEELKAARAQGIPVEIVPGVTAASAAGAALGRSLTERGCSDMLILATGTGADGAGAEALRLSGPGTTTALYMAAQQGAKTQASLREQGLPEDARIDIAAEVSHAGERLTETTLSHLPRDLDRHGITAQAIILVTNPSTAQAETAPPQEVALSA
ncbi:MAG: siroheme synthase CysG [Shimia sp.]